MHERMNDGEREGNTRRETLTGPQCDSDTWVSGHIVKCFHHLLKFTHILFIRLIRIFFAGGDRKHFKTSNCAFKPHDVL